MLKENIQEKGHDQHEKHQLHFTIENEKCEKQKFSWEKQYISGAELRKVGSIPPEAKIFLGIKRPWEDELVEDDTEVDLARPGIEHFYFKRDGEEKLVTIRVNDKEVKITRGKHKVAEIKKLGHVPPSHELSEVIDGKLTPLDNNAVVLIKGCEEFFSSVCDGSSS